MFDKAGLGLSDPIPQVRTLDDRVTEIEAVMDAVGFDDAVVFGMSEGGPRLRRVRGEAPGADEGADSLRLVLVDSGRPG